MNPNPKAFPILNYVMSKFPSFGPRHTVHSPDFDIEQPPPSPSDASASESPSFELTERMPHLKDAKVVGAMRFAVAEVARTRSVLQALGERPDHESVDIAKAKLSEIDAVLSEQLGAMVLSPDLTEEEKERRRAAEKDRETYAAVVQLDEMHEAYEKLLEEAEEKLMKIYESAVAGGDADKSQSEGNLPVIEEVNEEVVEILQEASKQGIARIDLSGRKLRLLPEAFGHLQQLVTLDLSSNQLEVIPDSISGLENIEELNLSSNLLGSLPDSIGLLFKLKILNVSGNKLTALPDSICHCRSLVELDASFNKLTYLPTNIGYELVNLKRLSVYLNKIRSLPTSIGEMRSLCILDAHFNELHGLPPSIGRLVNLEVLNLGSNFSDMIELPDTIGDLTNLKELDLSNNQISALPNTFGRLDSLTKLNLDQNPIVIPPKEVVNEGVEAVKAFMTNWWLDMLDEERKKMLEAQEQAQAGWLTRSTSWLNNFVSGYTGGGGKSTVDPFLDQQL